MLKCYSRELIVFKIKAHNMYGIRVSIKKYSGDGHMPLCGPDTREHRPSNSASNTFHIFVSFVQ